MHSVLTPPATPKLRERLRGEVICPGDARYDQSRRAWNSRIDRYPFLIVTARFSRVKERVRKAGPNGSNPH